MKKIKPRHHLNKQPLKVQNILADLNHREDQKIIVQTNNQPQNYPLQKATPSQNTPQNHPPLENMTDQIKNRMTNARQMITDQDQMQTKLKQLVINIDQVGTEARTQKPQKMPN
jgi:hypothetical protein